VIGFLTLLFVFSIFSDLAVFYPPAGGLGGYGVEGGEFGAGHPDLGGAGGEAFEQGGAADGV